MDLSGVHGKKSSPMSKIALEIAGQDGKWHPLKARTLPGLNIPGPKLEWSKWKQDKPRFQRLTAGGCGVFRCHHPFGHGTGGFVRPSGKED